jgi:hypothetical protein
MAERSKGEMRFARGKQGWYDRLQIWTGTEWQDITPGSASSLKQPALQALGRFSANAHTTGDEMAADFELLRQAVLQLPD